MAPNLNQRTPESFSAALRRLGVVPINWPYPIPTGFIAMKTKLLLLLIAICVVFMAGVQACANRPTVEERFSPIQKFLDKEFGGDQTDQNRTEE
jgi:hypothetical protein